MKVKKFIRTFAFTFFILSTIFIQDLVFAAPHPTTGSSNLNSAAWASVFSQMGFQFKMVSNEWIFIQNPLVNSSLTDYNKSAKNLQIDLGLKTLSETARFSFKIENFKLKKTNPDKPSLTVKENVESFAKKYLKDYRQYGFEITSTSSKELNGMNLVEIELKQKNNSTLSKQYFIGSTDKIAVANCIDKTYFFSMTEKLCNELIAQFTWKKL